MAADEVGRSIAHRRKIHILADMPHPPAIEHRRRSAGEDAV